MKIKREGLMVTLPLLKNVQIKHISLISNMIHFLWFPSFIYFCNNYIDIMMGISDDFIKNMIIYMILTICLHEMGHALAAWGNDWYLEEIGVGFSLILPIGYVKVAEECVLDSDSLLDIVNYIFGGVQMNFFLAGLFGLLGIKFNISFLCALSYWSAAIGIINLLPSELLNSDGTSLYEIMLEDYVLRKDTVMLIDLGFNKFIEKRHMKGLNRCFSLLIFYIMQIAFILILINEVIYWVRIIL